MATVNQTATSTEARTISSLASPQEIGESFLSALTAKDFDTVERFFSPKVNFRSLVPSGERFASTASAAVGWLRRWFGDEETIQVIESHVGMVRNILSIQYRFRVRAKGGEWQVIEQYAFCETLGGRITQMRLVCSGFHTDPNPKEGTGRESRPKLGGALFYDAGAKSCTEGPLEDISRLMRQLNSGQTLEVHATNPSVARDLPAWCRLTGHELINQEMDHFLIRHK